jgi:hypothetical protein
MEATLLGAVAFAIVATALYAKVGLQHVRRPVRPESRRAARMFGVWWLALGATTLLGGASFVAASAGFAPLPVFTAVLFLELLLICVGLLGLLHYLLFLFTGRDLLAPLAAGYAAYFLGLVVLLLQAMPNGVAVGRWTADVTYADPPAGPVATLLLGLLVLPQVLGALAYLTVAFRVREATPRFRIVVVSGSIVVWFLSSFLASVGGLTNEDWWQVLSRLLGLGAALATFVAYNPPRALTERWGIQALGSEASPPADRRPRAQRAGVVLVLLRRAPGS